MTAAEDKSTIAVYTYLIEIFGLLSIF